MTTPNTNPHVAPDADCRLDAALSRLAPRDLEPLAARGILLAAQRQLAKPRQPATGLSRHEPMCLVALSILELAWLALRLS